MSSSITPPRRRPWSRSLAAQLAAAAVLFGVVVAGIFAVMASTISRQRDAAREAQRTTELVALGNRLERLLIDTESGQRGFVISGQAPFLQPLRSARREIPGVMARMRALEGDAVVGAQLATLERGIDDYMRTWSDRVVAVARVSPARASRLVARGGGKRRIDALRVEFDRLLADRQAAAVRHAQDVDDRASSALVLGIAGFVISIAAFAAFATYVVRAIVVPVRRTASAAARIQGGDLDARVRGEGRAQAELGSLVRGFNAMADTLRANHTALAAQNEELEQRGDELRAQREELEGYAQELEAHRAELETVVAQLEAEKDRIGRSQEFGLAVASEGRFEQLADLTLARTADALRADVGALWIVDPEHDYELRLATTRGLERRALAEVLDPGVGLAGRAAAERGIVRASFDGSSVKVPAYGLHVVVRHELHVPLVQDGSVLGVLTLARIAGEPWPPGDEELARSLADRSAAAVAKALALRESSSRLALTRAVLDATPDAIGLVAPDGRVALANEPMREAVGRLGSRAVGAALTAGAEPVRDELEGPDGRVLARYVAALGPEDGARGTLVVLRDVTAERQAERLKDEFFALVSHELRTPLTSVIGYLELLREESDHPYLPVIERNARRLLRLVGDLLFVAQIEAGRLTLDLGEADPAAIARQAVEAARPRAAEAGVELVADVADVGDVVGDADRLGQAVDNLVSNALKFTPAGGTVTVRLQAEGDLAVLEVADTGMGIAEADHEHLFERFFRAGAATSAAIQGVGLGLTIVRAIVEGHGGRIGVTSREGHGATFRVELPLRPRGDHHDGDGVATRAVAPASTKESA